MLLVDAWKPFFSSVRYSYVLYGIFCLSFLCKNILCLFVCQGISVRRQAAQIGCRKTHFFAFSQLFHCFEPLSEQPKQTYPFRNKPKKYFLDFTPTGAVWVLLGRHVQVQHEAPVGRHEHVQCGQTRPGAAPSSCRQTCTGAAQARVDRHVQVQRGLL